jgi:WXXGXW repeat (2 copies)
MQLETNTIRRAFGAIALSGALALAAGCHSNSVSASGPDPAQANLAPVNGQTQVLGQNASYSPQQQSEAYPQQQGYPQQAPAPIEQAYPQQAYPQQPGYQPTPDEQAGEEALEESTQPPPELPEYDQPPAPGPGYMWTPGYWAWGPGGYYWVPGAWVEAPYSGALWTPPYWGWNGGYYRFYPGYWGRHVGYYGGINYGFGYIGIGYFGGYWSGNSFYYNSAVTRVSPMIRTVYERPVIYNNVRYGVQPVNRVSYNGGHGGINVQPRPAEIAAMHERHDPPVAAQRQARVEASQNHAQSFAVNRGRPAMAYAPQGFARGSAPASAPRVEAARTPAPNPAVNRAQPQPYAGHFDNRTQPQPQPQQPRVEQPRTDNRAMQPQPNNGAPRFDHQPSPQPQPHAEYRPQPQPQPQPRAEAPQVENRPAPQPQPQREAPRVENRPQPQQQPHPQAPPPQSHPAPPPQPHNNGGGHPSGGDHSDHDHR